MTILIHEYHDLEERASGHLKKWKVCHTILYILAAIFGILNYTFLQNSMTLIDNNCILYPRDLQFHMVEIPEYVNHHLTNKTEDEELTTEEDIIEGEEKNDTDTNDNEENEEAVREKRGVVFTYGAISEDVEIVKVGNATVIVGNKTLRLMLDTQRSLFGNTGCEFTEYMPLMATVFAIVWAVMFIMCPGGGYTRTGLTQPWRILMPALLFSLVLVGLTGHSFATTSAGITAFCQEFRNLTGDGTCDSASAYLERGWNVTGGLGARAAAAQAMSAALWATWAAAAALLLARCLTGPDFAVRRTGVLIKDPAKKLLPYLVPLSQSSARSSGRTASKRDNLSVISDPTTVTTELVTATVENPPDSLTHESEKVFGTDEDVEMTERSVPEPTEEK